MSASHDPHAQLPPKVQVVIDAAVARYEAWTVWRERYDGATLAERNAFYDAGRKLDAAVAEYLKERG